MASFLHSNLGPLKVGYFVATFLFAVVTVQTHRYFREFNGDPALFKILVMVIWLTELIHQISLGFLFHWFTITCFGTLGIYTTPLPQTFAAVIVATTIIALLVSSFFTYRLWASTGNVVLVVVSVVLVAGRFISSCIVADTERHGLTLTAFIAHGKPLMTTAWACSAAIDLLLTLALCYDLHSRQHMALYRTARMIDRLMMLCVATGMLTSISTIAVTICFLTMDNAAVWTAFYIPISRMFSTSLLVSLNARKCLRHAGSSMVIDMDSRSQALRQQGSKDSSSCAPLEVTIVRETLKNTPNLCGE
ncbi:hypothetical protein Hypma_004722 [Hypsizygus marmoreus]|uniref:DUF6534 domain-containing protein n=1 Tax=Hypsizygus marmoreus TaxID=39966 RepID=A0A369J693_HYPMA|nr:hypothetical protein Hypma_004722 [Hypsizygus marmoreus]